jgi:hypothetical protein
MAVGAHDNDVEVAFFGLTQDVFLGNAHLDNDIINGNEV